MEEDFVYIDEYGILGSNFYWKKGIEMGLSKNELASVGLTDERVRVHKGLIEPLNKADKRLQEHGYRLYITEGYRPKELYEFVNQKMIEHIGEEQKNKILNMKDMPHVTGKSVDAGLLHNGERVILRDKSEGVDAFFVDHYKNNGTEKGKEYQRLQELMIKSMLDNGFRIGTKGEYFHFNYSPDLPRNYE